MLSTLNVCDLCLRTVEGWRGAGEVTTSAPVNLRHYPTHVTLGGMDTSTTPHISPVLEAEARAALMLRYAEDNKEIAYQYAHALVRSFTVDLGIPEALQLTRDIVTESTNEIRNFEGGETASRIEVALRRLIDRVEADAAFMTELAELAD